MRPLERANSWNLLKGIGGRVDEPEHLGSLAPSLPVERHGVLRKEVGEDGDGPAGAGFRERRGGETPDAQVIIRAAR
jgi:hypothetical protein